MARLILMPTTVPPRCQPPFSTSDGDLPSPGNRACVRACVRVCVRALRSRVCYSTPALFCTRRPRRFCWVSPLIHQAQHTTLDESAMPTIPSTDEAALLTAQLETVNWALSPPGFGTVG